MEQEYTVLNELSWTQKDKHHMRKAEEVQIQRAIPEAGAGRGEGGCRGVADSVTTVHSLGIPGREMTRSPKHKATTRRWQN